MSCPRAGGSASPSDVVDSYPLSPTQAGMLYHAIGEAHAGVDIEQVVITLRESLDERLFVGAWHEVARRHTILRTRFRWEGIPEFLQEVVDNVEIPVATVDWSGCTPEVTQDRWAAQLACDRRHDFDLTRAPAMRLFIACIAADEYRVVWTFHHALLDGRSFARVLREIFAIYDATRGGEEVRLADARPYREYIEWHQSVDLRAAEQYWRAALRGFHAATPLTVDRPAAASAPTEGALYDARQMRLAAQFTSALRDTAVAAGVTVNTLLLAAWAIVLHRYSGEPDIVFGATRAGRHFDFEGKDTLIGLFINTLPVRVRVDDDRPVLAWLQALRQQLVDMRPHDHAPLVKVQSWSQVTRGKPLFESLVVYDHRSLDAQLHSLGGPWEGRRFEYIGQTNYPLTVVAYGDDEMVLRIEYSRQRFSDSTVERMLGHLGNVLLGLARPEGRRVKDLTPVSPAERAALLAGAAGHCSYARGAVLHERLERQVERTPEATALVAFGAGGERIELSYEELNRRANVVAHALRDEGVVPNQLVGLRTERNAEMVIGILAILKSGGAYLPLDPVYPKERVAFMLEDSSVAVVLTQTTLKADLADAGVTLICLDEPAADEAAGQANPSASSGPDDLAYVIYTSGSTGKPKGARITHHNVARLFAATEAWYGFDQSDVWTLFHSYAFDFSVWELWGALLYGGRVVVVPLEASRSSEDFHALLVREQVTVLNQTPTAFRPLIEAAAQRPQAKLALRYVIFGGEALELQSLRPWFDLHGDQRPRLINMYGITETTVHVSYRPITQADLDAGAGSVIGVPLADLRIYILDPQGEPVPIGVAGEMFVAGGGVALGYLNRPELSSQRFVRDPFDADPTARMYRTGDLARRLDNGDIEYLGRIDQQVKIRGFRIELGEIEAQISQHPQVRQVAVIAREDAPGDKRLVAYLVASDEPAALVQQLRHNLRSALPDYMLPAHFVCLPALPLTNNGKLDRSALPAPASAAAAPRAVTLSAPTTPHEIAVAEIWCRLLGLEQVSVTDNFFDLGGHSMLATRAIKEMSKELGIRVPFRRMMFESLGQLSSVHGDAANRDETRPQVRPGLVSRWLGSLMAASKGKA